SILVMVANILCGRASVCHPSTYLYTHLSTHLSTSRVPALGTGLINGSPSSSHLSVSLSVRQQSPFSPVKGSAFRPTSHREDGVKSDPIQE
ncbi:hypothetical protein KUCAC02_000044, partial [Chaenocephalus aceratus]